MKAAHDRPSLRVLGLFGLGVAVFLARGAYRALHGSADLGLVYLAVRAWAAGTNPYSVAESEALAPADFPPTLDLNGIPSPHAPGFFPLFFFYRWLSWSEVVVFNLLVGCAVFGVALHVFSARLGWSLNRRLVLIALVLIGYPLSTGVALGQPAVLAVAMALFVLTARLDGRRAEWVGLFAAAGLLLKPQVGIALPLYLLFRRDLRAVAWCGCFYGAVNALSLAFMALSGATLRGLSGVLEGIRKSNATQADPFCCVNFNRGTVPFLLGVGLIALGLMAFVARSGWFEQVRRTPSEKRSVGAELIPYSVAITVSLLSVYHRPYVLVAVAPLLWLALSPERPSAERWMSACLLVPVVQPVPWLPLARVIELRLDGIWASLFHVAVRPLHSWTLLALLYLLALGASTSLSRTTE